MSMKWMIPARLDGHDCTIHQRIEIIGFVIGNVW